MTNKPRTRYAGLFRRLLAICYDTFLLLAILFIVTIIANALNQGEAITPQSPYYPLYVFSLLLLVWFYFAWFWVHGGQSLGMKTWHLQLVDDEGNFPGWKSTVVRFVVAILSWSVAGLGFFWSVFDAQKRCWHDIASHTVLLDTRELSGTVQGRRFIK